MSTLFAIKVKDEFENVAKRHNGGRIELFNKLLLLINKNVKVYALDNTPQGIYTVGDIIKHVEWKDEKDE